MAQRKKILILSSTGGGGHIAATNALTEYLGTQYNIKTIFPFKTFLSPTDITLALTFGRWDGEHTYNFFVRKNYFRIINLFAKFGQQYFNAMYQRTSMRMHQFLKKENPDLVISLIPLINGATLEACKKLQIPFLLIPTDLDTTYFLCNINKPAYEKFIFTIPFEDEKIKDLLKPAHIPPYQMHVTGFLLRPAFLHAKNNVQKETIKQEFHLPENKPIIFLMMGAQGSDSLLDFTKKLALINSPAHLLIGIGKNTELAKKINLISFPEYISYTIIGYTDRIADLMAVSDIFITKGGSVSFAEAIEMGVPLLIDATHTVLKWEQFNIDFMKRHGFGEPITSLNTLACMIEDLITHPKKLEAIKKRMKNFPKKNGLEEVSKIIEKLLEK